MCYGLGARKFIERFNRWIFPPYLKDFFFFFLLLYFVLIQHWRQQSNTHTDDKKKDKFIPWKMREKQMYFKVLGERFETFMKKYKFLYEFAAIKRKEVRNLLLFHSLTVTSIGLGIFYLKKRNGSFIKLSKN